ncbi:hypothetical protein SANT12839_073760 [Streptomyces antimycoticus]|uniref:Uncharacterized protein n=1 Tax=Streptomyces antimycoticus TaxID=68175 RepID=A0A4D4KEB2_9ACTN|nr:hypothetical protein SANT12839_073760 [Streptomyces antimycoticus]
MEAVPFTWYLVLSGACARQHMGMVRGCELRIGTDGPGSRVWARVLGGLFVGRGGSGYSGALPEAASAG